MAGTVVLDRYALLEQIGSGGFGVVWLARDERLERLVAVKRIPVAGGAAAARAEKEALAAARLAHPAVVSLYEAGRDDSAVYLVSELVRGHTLDELLHEGALSDRDVLLIGIAMCDALGHAHARGVTHRDVKPGNVLIPEAPVDGVVAKLTDFGIARITGDDALTRTGDVVGTLAYMAPEQAEGRGATAASDLYALALVLYEALCGVNPVRGPNAAATARNVGMRLPSLRGMRRDLPRGLCAAIDAAVQVDPALRGSLDSLRLALAEALPHVGDEPGTVDAPAWAGKATTVVGPPAQRRWGRGERARPEPRGRVDETPPHHAWAGEAPIVVGSPAHGRWRVALPARIATAAMTTGVVAALSTLSTLAPLPVDLPTVLGVTAVATALLPRLGWLAVLTAAVVWLGREGPSDAWWIVTLAAAPMPLLLPLRPAWWSAPAIAAALGWAGVAAAWPAVAGQARTLWTRAVLGAAGWWVLALAEMLRGERAVDLEVLARDPAIAVAGVWAAAAAVLPVVVRGRNVAVDLLGAVLWAAALAAGTDAAGGGTMVGAAALAALLAVLAGAVKRA